MQMCSKLGTCDEQDPKIHIRYISENIRFFWYLPLIVIFLSAGDVSLANIGWLLILSVFPPAYALLGCLQADQIALKVGASKLPAFRMSLLSLLGGAILQGLALSLYSGGVGAFAFMVAIILLFGFLPALFVATLFIGFCENV